jgi:hypothetical protein
MRIDIERHSQDVWGFGFALTAECLILGLFKTQIEISWSRL